MTNKYVKCYTSCCPNAFQNLVDGLTPVKKTIALKYGNARFECKDYKFLIPHPEDLMYLVIAVNGDEEWRKALRQSFIRSVKIYLREHNESFVTPEGGENPIAAYVAKFNAAMDAPRLAGIEDVFAEVGVTVNPKRDKMMTDEQVEELCQKILIDDEKLGKYNKNRLLLAMGLENFNRFVEKYNTGK